MKTLRMLYIEDDPQEYRMYAEDLRKRGWLVERSYNPPDALERLRKALPPFDAILIDRDLTKPEARRETWEWGEWGDAKYAGDRLLDRVVVTSPYICPLMLTGTGDIKSARDLTKHGAQDYITKETPASVLDARCRQGVLRQQLKRLRHTFLRQPTFNALLKEVFLFIRDAYDKEGRALNLFYLDVVPGRALQLHAALGNPRSLATARVGVDSSGSARPLVSASGTIEQVLRRSCRALTVGTAALRDQTLTETAVMQLLVPVLVVHHPDQAAHRPVGVFALECDEAFLENADLELFENVAGLLADYLATRAWQRRSADEERVEEQKAMLDGIACRLCSPLQQAQSTLELLHLQVREGKMPDPDHLREILAEALESVERATLATENLRLFQPAPSLNLCEVDLVNPVQRTLHRCQANLLAAGVQVDDEHLEHHAAVPCHLDTEHFCYALEGLLRNCWETALREPAGRPGGERHWQLTVRLDLDPQKRSARLTLRDNGPGFRDDVLERFAEGRFIPSQKRANGMRRKGLGLVEARRFLEMSEGRLEICNAPEGGALVHLFLPLSAAVAPGAVVPTADD